MIKKIAWEAFKNTGDINAYMEFKQIENLEKQIDEEQENLGKEEKQQYWKKENEEEQQYWSKEEKVREQQENKWDNQNLR